MNNKGVKKTVIATGFVFFAYAFALMFVHYKSHHDTNNPYILLHADVK